MREALRLAVDLVIAPRRAAERLRKDGALSSALIVYGVFVAASVAYYTLKPEDFPPVEPSAMPMLGVGRHGLLFWIKVEAWQPLLTAVWLVFLAWYCEFLKAGKSMARRLLLGAVLCAVPALPWLLYYSGEFVSKPVMALLWVGIFGAMTPWLRARRESWTPLLVVLLATNVVNLALLPLFASSILISSARAYFGLEIVMLLWTIGLSSFLIGKVEGLSTPRACAAIFLSAVCQLNCIFTLRLLDIVPKDVLKALMAV
ncbi:MAG: hypothetical protein HY078_12860 [Elusimicrobia bacterium]|nr:hypothetical protein [Elusimicrobiota bacterium]